MLQQSELDAFDCLQWLGSGALAGQFLQCSQATISRQARSVTHFLQLRLQRQADGFKAAGNHLDLLQLEREIHQLFRFNGRGWLRLQVPAGGRAHLLSSLPLNWRCGPCRPKEAFVSPMDLLSNLVVDACIVQPTQLAQMDPDRIWSIPLFSSPLQLVSLDGEPGKRFDLQSGRAALVHLPWVPLVTRRAIEGLHRGLVGPEALPAQERTLPVTYVNSLALQFERYRPLEVALNRQTGDHLVCLREHRQQPALQVLLEVLQDSLFRLRRRGLSLEVCL